MNRLPFALILTSLSAALGSSSASAQIVLQRCDKVMAQAESVVNQVGECFDRAKGAAAAIREPAYEELLAYAAYSAYASGGVAACAPQPFATWEERCRGDVSDLSATRAAMGTPAEFVSACVKIDLPKTAEAIKKAAECCTALSDNRGRPNPCAKLVPRCEPDLGACVAYMSSLEGNAAACGRIVPGNEDSCLNAADCRRQQVDCRGTALFVKAYKAKNIALCGTSDRCRVLMGAGRAVVQERAAKLAKTPAGRWYLKREWATAAQNKAPHAPAARGEFSCDQHVASPENQKAVMAALTAPVTCFAEIEAALPRENSGIIQKIDAQLERLARLDYRVKDYFDKAGPDAPAKNSGTPPK